MKEEGFIIDANSRMKQNQALAHRAKERKIKPEVVRDVSRRKAAYRERADHKAIERTRHPSKRGQVIDFLISASIAIIVITALIAIGMFVL